MAEEQIGKLRARLREARARFVAAPRIEVLREICRLPLDTWLALPELLKLHLQEPHSRGVHAR